MKISKALVLATIICIFTFSAFAKTTCGPVYPNGQNCTSEVEFSKFAESFAAQEQSQWCWAAVISMIFDYHGHPVAQGRIVETLYGRRINLPSGNGYNMASRLNSDWVDDNGKRFSARLTAAYDSMAGVHRMTNAMIVRELDQGRPFVIGTNGHAVVATQVTYVRGPWPQPVITSIGVFDPWPGRGSRSLTQAEILPVERGGVLQFAATSVISDK